MENGATQRKTAKTSMSFALPSFYVKDTDRYLERRKETIKKLSKDLMKGTWDTFHSQ